MDSIVQGGEGLKQDFDRTGGIFRISSYGGRKVRESGRRNFRSRPVGSRGKVRSPGRESGGGDKALLCMKTWTFSVLYCVKCYDIVLDSF